MNDFRKCISDLYIQGTFVMPCQRCCMSLSLHWLSKDNMYMKVNWCYVIFRYIVSHDKIFKGIYVLFWTQNGSWAAEKVITIPPKTVDNWALPEMPGEWTINEWMDDDRHYSLANWELEAYIYIYIYQIPERLIDRLVLGGHILDPLGIKQCGLP